MLQDKVARVEQAYRAAAADDRDRRRDEYLATLNEWMNFKLFGELPADCRRAAAQSAGSATLARSA
jgi:hypothetical protein